MKCVECGADSADVTQLCARCGAPVAGPPLAAAETDPGPAIPAPAAVRWLLLAFLILFLVLFVTGQVVAVHTVQQSRLDNSMIGISWLGIFGAWVFVIFFECTCSRFARAQWWAVVPVASFAFLAFAPFLWLALVRRRVRDWAVVAIYLAGSVTVTIAFSRIPGDVSISGRPSVIWALLMVIAPVHAVLAFSPAAQVPAWPYAWPAWTIGKHRRPVTDAVPPEDGGSAIDPRRSVPEPRRIAVSDDRRTPA